MKKILKNLFYNFILTLISRIGALIFTIFIARMLFPELFGIYSLALTIILTIATFTDLGLNSTLIKYTSESLKRKNYKKARAKIFYIFNLKFILTLIISILLFFISNFLAIYIFKKPLLSLPLKIGAIYLFIISFYGFLTSIFFALQKVEVNAISEFIFQLLRIFFVYLFFITYKKNVEIVFISLIFALFLSSIFLIFILCSKYNFLIKGKKEKLEKKEKRKILTFFTWLTISSISIVFFAHIDVIMLGIFLPAHFVGYYNAIFTIIASVASFFIFGNILLAIFSQINKEKFEKCFKKVFLYVTSITIPATVGLAYIIIPAIKIIYGSVYVPEPYKLVITLTSILLSLLIIESSLTAIYSSLFQAKEMPKIPSILIVIVTILNIILNWFLIKLSISFSLEYGIIGAAVATLVSRYFNLFGLVVLARKKLKIKTNLKILVKPLLASFIMLGFLFVFDYFVSLSLLKGILMIIAAILIYFTVIFLIGGITKEDFKIIRMLITK